MNPMSLFKNAAITKLEPRHFRVDFDKLRRSEQGVVRSLLGGRQITEVDPFLVAQTVREVLQRCETRNVHGKLLLWNELRIFLSSSDYEALRPLAPRLQAGLDTVFRTTLSELRAETVGDLTVRLLVDEEREALQGTGDVLASYVRGPASETEISDDEITIRVESVGCAPRTFDEITQPIREPASPGSIGLFWAQEQAMFVIYAATGCVEPLKEAIPRKRLRVPKRKRSQQ